MASYFYPGPNGSWTISQSLPSKPLTKLPTGTYTVQSGMEGFFLQTMDDMVVPSKIYGSVEADSNRILGTFFSREKSTGVLLSGEKGSGKTLTIKFISRELRKSNIPTIIVDASYTGAQFKSFIDSIDQECLIIFDEFEKIYSRKEYQMDLLTLFDGLYTHKKLFVVSCNDQYSLDKNFKNRPGRFFYHLRYEGISEEFVKEYASNNLDNKDHIDNLVSFSNLFTDFNFDMLASLVEEMNRYKETAFEAAKYVNSSPRESSYEETYEIVDFEYFKEDGFKAGIDSKYNTTRGNLLEDGVTIVFEKNFNDDRIRNRLENIGQISFTEENIIKVDNGKTFTLKSDLGKAVIRKKKPSFGDYNKYYGMSDL